MVSVTVYDVLRCTVNLNNVCRLQQDAFAEDVWDLRVLPIGIPQDVLAEDNLAVLIQNVATDVDQVPHRVDQATFKVIFVIVERVFRHVSV